MNRSALPQFESIRAWRGVAAMCVAISHLQPFMPASYTSGVSALPFAAGKAGVDVFFVISGFVMAIATADLPAGRASGLGFLWRRLARIAPLYWIVTWGLVTAILLGMNLGGQRSVDWEQLVRSLLFLPVHSVDGGIRPVIAVGWTLDYEMYFYLCMSVTVGLFVRHRLTGVSVMMVGIYLLASATLDPRLDWVVNAGLASEFLFGFLAARCYREKFSTGLLCAFSLSVCWIMLPEFRLLHPYGAGFDRALSWGMLALLLILGSAFIEHRFPIGKIPLMGALGDASYALYLVHIPAFAVVSRIQNNSGVELGPLASGATLVAGATGIAIVLHRLIEKPLTIKLQKLSPFTARAQPPVHGAAP